MLFIRVSTCPFQSTTYHWQDELADPTPSPRDAPSINPYAPLSETPLVDDLTKQVGRPVADGTEIVWRTIFAVTFSGSAFGLLFGLVIAVGNGSLGSAGNLFPGILFLLLFAAILGLILAFAGSLFVVPVGYWTTCHFNQRRWTGRSIRNLGLSTGAVTGWVCVALPNAFSLWSVMMGAVPAVFGGLGTLLMINGLARRTDKALSINRSIADEVASHRASHDDAALSAAPFVSDAPSRQFDDRS